MAAQSAPKRSYSLKQALAARLATKHGIDPTAAADAGDPGAAILDNVSRAKATKGKEQAKYIAAAQAGLRRLDAKKHSTLINGVQAKLLALQGRGGDTKVAHVTPGEVVIPRSVLTQELAELIAAEAARQGIDPGRFVVGGERASVNPETDVEEFWAGAPQEQDSLEGGIVQDMDPNDPDFPKDLPSSPQAPQPSQDQHPALEMFPPGAKLLPAWPYGKPKFEPIPPPAYQANDPANYAKAQEILKPLDELLKKREIQQKSMNEYPRSLHREQMQNALDDINKKISDVFSDPQTQAAYYEQFEQEKYLQDKKFGRPI